MEAARNLYREGAALIHEERWDEARDRFERSLALKRAPRTLFSLGVAQQKTGHLADALESYRAFRVEPDSSRDPYFEQAGEAIVDLEKRVAYLSLHIAPAPAGLHELRVTIDGHDVPPAALATRRLLDPGTHQVVAIAAGYQDARASVTLGEGGQASVSLSLEPAFAPAGTVPLPTPTLVASLPPPPPGDAGPRASSSALPVALMVSGGAVFLVGVSVGMVGVAAAASAPTRDGPEATAARKKMLAGDLVGGTGVVAAGAGLALLLLRRLPARPPASAVAGQVEPWIQGSTTGARAGASVRF